MSRQDQGGWSMKKTFLYCLLCILTAAAFLPGCNKTSADGPAANTAAAQADSAERGNSRFSDYDGFAFIGKDGRKKYVLEAQNGVRLHCYFRTDPGEYEETVYDLELTGGRASSADAVRVAQEQAGDQTPSFKKFSFAFYPDKVIMTVERNTDMMAGGDSDNLQTGTYTLLAADAIPWTTAAESEKKENPIPPPYQGIELAAMARAYYFKEYNFLAPATEYIENGDGTTAIHLFEIAEDSDGVSHTGTSAWYTVDAYGNGQDDVDGNAVELPALSVAGIIEYMGMPEELSYSEEGEAHSEWQISDPETIDSCMQALKQLEIGDETMLRAADAGETLTFKTADQGTWILNFESGNLLRNGSCYETRGWGRVRNILRDYIKGRDL